MGLGGGLAVGRKKPLLGTPSSLTPVPYPALSPHPFLRLVLRLPNSNLLSFVWTVPFSPIPLHTPSRGQIYTYIKVVNM